MQAVSSLGCDIVHSIIRSHGHFHRIFSIEVCDMYMGAHAKHGEKEDGRHTSDRIHQMMGTRVAFGFGDNGKWCMPL